MPFLKCGIWLNALSTFASDETIRVVVLSGGKSFVSGADISKFEKERGSEEVTKQNDAMLFMTPLKPIPNRQSP